MTPKTHILSFARDRTLCGRTPESVLLIDMRRQCVDEATCRNCWRADDALQIRNHLRECREAGIDPNTMEKLK